jgi:hypothetical protein
MAGRTTVNDALIRVTDTNGENEYLYGNIPSGCGIYISEERGRINFQGYDVFSNGADVTSDINKKNVIENELSIEKCYELVDMCSTIIYTLKDDKKNKIRIGMIAQEVEKYFPEAVTTDSDGSKSMSYNAIITICMRLLKDINKRMRSIENRLSALESK